MNMSDYTCLNDIFKNDTTGLINTTKLHLYFYLDKDKEKFDKLEIKLLNLIQKMNKQYDINRKLLLQKYLREKDIMQKSNKKEEIELVDSILYLLNDKKQDLCNMYANDKKKYEENLDSLIYEIISLSNLKKKNLLNQHSADQKKHAMQQKSEMQKLFNQHRTNIQMLYDQYYMEQIKLQNTLMKKAKITI